MGKRFSKFCKAMWAIYNEEKTPSDMAIDYLKDQYDALTCPVGKMSDELRYQHMLLVGGSGCGKSTFFQQLLTRDIPRMKAGRCSIVHIDPVNANDGIIRHAGVHNYRNAILIDVSDPDSLPCLDIFETSSSRDERLRTSNLIGVFKDVCAGLVEQAMTPQMNTLFSYCAQVAVRMERPGLREILELLTDPIEVLTRYEFDPNDAVFCFFKEEVVGNGKGRTPMRETATSLRARIHGVLCDPIVERLFCRGKPTLNLIEAINEGCGIFVATRKGHLTTDGARGLGNYILTMTHRAMQERVDLDPDEMKPTFLYYDEFQNALSGGGNKLLAEMLDENRKYKLGCHLATTRFGHLAPAMSDAILACTETKVIGKMSQKGAAAIALDLFPGEQGSIGKLTEIGNYKFYCRIKSLHDRAIQIKTQPDPIKRLGRSNKQAMPQFRERMKLKYGSGRMVEQDALEVEQGSNVIEIPGDKLAAVGAL